KEKLSPVIGLDGYAAIVNEVRAEDILLPIVAIGGITIDDIDAIMQTGVNGIAMSGAIINSPDPVAYMRQVLEKIHEAAEKYRKR
ncbi:MAG: thiamine phosphate synthase, partial [Duncaniella sp.]|nr:thiamine phosphate synthase [Duncaniella sp.]